MGSDRFGDVRSVLVTGAAGFIGSHVVESLLHSGLHVVGLDNLNPYYDTARKRANLEEIATRARTEPGRFTFVEGDIRDRPLLGQLFERHGPGAVVHLAAMPGVRASVDDPWFYYDVNLTGTLNLLELTRTHGRPNFVFASTSSAYGATQRIPFSEDDTADRPLAPYPASKRSAELLGHVYHHLHGVDFTALRFFTVYGPRGRPDMLAYKAMENVFRGRALQLYRKGQISRDWTFVSDIVSGIVAAVERRLGYEVINLGRGEPVLVADFVRALEEQSGRRAEVTDGPLPDADVEITFADIGKAQRLLGYSPTVSVREGVLKMMDWYKQAALGGAIP